MKIENPALKNFVSRIGDEFVMAQVLIQRQDAGYELRQVEDKASAVESLRLVKLADARALAQFTAAGEFRPLKSAPTLQRGWRMTAADDVELEALLSRIYPGAIADWHAEQSSPSPVTNYRDYVGRQSGMYRITAMLTDAQAADVARTVCDVKCCLKQRLWTVPELEPDVAALKSIIPCLEPCAILLEAARKALRAEQEKAKGGM